MARSLTADSVANLPAVLSAISGRTRMPIVVADSLSDARVSIALRAVPLEDGLKRLLAPYNAFYLFTANEGKPASIQTIWVFAQGEGHELEPVPPTVWGGPKDLEARLDDADAEVRGETIEALIERLGERGLPDRAARAVGSRRGRAAGSLSAVGDAGIRIPSTDLHTVVLTDQSQAVRMAALEELAGRPEAEAIARTLRDDVDRVIRTRARQILGEQELEPNSSLNEARAKNRRASSKRTPVTPTTATRLTRSDTMTLSKHIICGLALAAMATVPSADRDRRHASRQLHVYRRREPSSRSPPAARRLSPSTARGSS